LDNSTKLYSIVNKTVNDVADRRNKSNNFFQLRHYKNRHKCVLLLAKSLFPPFLFIILAQDHIRFQIEGCFPVCSSV